MPRSPARPVPPEVAARIAGLGARIKEARQRRNLRQVDLAERTGLSRSSIEAIERGSADTSIGSFVRALWVLGLDRELDVVADSAVDREGAALEFDPRERRVRVRKGLDDDF
ncbi:helix-turn-helix domain-containing protein [Ramlibacter albus]|uniref:Helix-turn-helix transcriptional regulator n=1 Tax=Ramlibacter albus TaxID=2079448 RepID=A0A923MF65_9BURK|nr:helix-turn-helix transcriptional regulator [Ramlibacter albus]MBC5768324.1 helix-turn-helix transcriptional regulator [Ramlibacter albus]